MDIQKVKNYLRIDDDDDDEIILAMMEATEQYIIDAAGSYDDGNPRARMLYFMIVQDFYEHRVLTVKETDKQRLTHAAGSIILQLQIDELIKAGDASD